MISKANKVVIDLIITVTMNPAIDKTAEVKEINIGSLNRIEKVLIDAGGKGINVSKVIKELGGETLACGFMGRQGSEIILSHISEEGINNDFILVEGETRTNMKILTSDGRVTELNEPGPTITAKDMDRLIEKLCGYADSSTMFILAGSVPRGVSKDIYADITVRLKARGAAVIVDADGELFKRAIEQGPDIIKPNNLELDEYFKSSEPLGDRELALKCRLLLNKGIKLAVISQGSKRAIFITENQSYKSSGLKVKSHSTVGAGDAMVAALAYAFEKDMTIEDTIRLSMAVAAGAVTTLGTKAPPLELVKELMKKVLIETI